MQVSVYGTRSVDALAYEDIGGKYAYEEWGREIGYNSRILGLRAHEAARALAARSAPRARALYRPNRGESLYGISLRFYKTAEHWIDIYERNGLVSFILAGSELLEIPELS